MISPRTELPQSSLSPGLPTLALAAGMSILLHLGAMAALAPRDMTILTGDGDDTPPALGTSFSDFADGTLSPEIPQTLSAHKFAPTAEHGLLAPLTPAAATIAPAMAAEHSNLTPDQAASSEDRAETATAPTQSKLLVSHQAIAVMQDVPAQAPVSIAESTEQPTLLAAMPSQSATVEPATGLSPARSARPELLLPDTTPTSLAPDVSRMPRARPDRTTRARPQREATQPQGTAPQTARGSRAQSPSASPAPAMSQPSRANTAAASNYPGEVLRRIQRIPQARSPGRGSVLVTFSVSNNGGLGSVSVARSSGNPALDRVALDHIRRAAPFPPPPEGAQRQFSFEFVGR